MNGENSYMPRVNGIPFRCTCGCNVFHKPDPTERPNIYECNACGTWYEGEPAED